MNAEHEKETVRKTDAFERGQDSPSPDYEKGASDQKFQISQVGHTGNDRKGDASSEPGITRPRSAARSGWFDDKTKEIGDETSPTQLGFGWVYVRTKTGHRKEWTARRGRVS